MARRVRAAGGRLVLAAGHHLGQTQPHAGIRTGPLHQIARICVPAHQECEVLLRCCSSCGTSIHIGSQEVDRWWIGEAAGSRSETCGVQRPLRRTDHGRRIAQNPQPPLRLDHRHAARERSTLCHLPRSTCRALHPRRHIGKGRVPGVRQAVGEGGGKEALWILP